MLLPPPAGNPGLGGVAGSLGRSPCCVSRAVPDKREAQPADQAKTPAGSRMLSATNALKTLRPRAREKKAPPSFAPEADCEGAEDDAADVAIGLDGSCAVCM